MANLGDLVVNLSATTKPFIGAIGQAQRTLTGFVGPTFNALKNLGFAAAGLNASFGALETIAMPIRLAAEAEQTATAFRVMIGSAKQANDLLADLQKFTAATPFREDEVKAAARQLLAMGTESRDVANELQMLGDIAAGTGTDIADLAQLFGTFRIQQKIMTQDLRQLLNRGIPVLQQLAKQFGVTEDAVFDLASKGKLSFRDIERALHSLTSEGGIFFGLMKEQSQTVAGLWSNLQDEITHALRQIGVVLVKELDIKQLTADLIAFAKTMKTSVIPAVAAVIQETSKTFRFLSDEFSKLQIGLTVKLAELMGADRQSIIEELAQPILERMKQDQKDIDALVDRMVDMIAEGNVQRRIGDVAPIGAEQLKQLDALKERLDAIDQSTAVPAKEIEGLRTAFTQLQAVASSGVGVGRFNELAKDFKDMLQQAERADIMDMLGLKDDTALRAFAKKLKESTITPMETFQQQIKDIQAAMAAGFINSDVAQRAIEAARKEFMDATKGSGANRAELRSLAKGSQEAFDVIRAAQTPSGKDAVAQKIGTTNKILADMKDELKKQTAMQKKPGIKIEVADI